MSSSRGTCSEVLAAVIISAVATGCVDPSDRGNDSVGVAVLALSAPAGIQSVRVRFTGITRTVERCVAVDGSATTRLESLPTGSVAVDAFAYAPADCTGDAVWAADPVTMTLVAGQLSSLHIVFRPNGIVSIDTEFIDDQLVNLAFNPSCSGFPSIAESDRSWGCSNPCDVLDGLHSYDSFCHGLAFTGGHQNGSGGPPWIEPAGIRHLVVSFDQVRSFAKAIIWWHGVEYTPDTGVLEYWNNDQWFTIPDVRREYGTMHEEGSNSGYSDSDIYTFAAVRGSKFRYTFDNSGHNIVGTFNIHGWVYEVEVFGPPQR